MIFFNSANAVLQDELVKGPGESCFETDLICVLHDVSNRYVREAISKRVLNLLIRNPDVPAILVLNKMDTVPHSKRMYDLIRKLTCGQLEGQRQVVNIKKGAERRQSVETYFKRRQKKQARMTHGQPAEEEVEEEFKTDKIKIRSYDDLMRVIKGDTSQYNMDELVDDLSTGLVGWPGFRDVFTISALYDNGVEDLREYMVSANFGSSFELIPYQSYNRG